MTPAQITIVQSTFAALAQEADALAAEFYERLFARDASLRTMFNKPMERQRALLIHMLTLVVSQLDRIEDVAPALRRLGEQHAKYGVRAEHYAAVGAALLETISKRIGEAFTTDVRDSWTAAYGLIAAGMNGDSDVAKTCSRD